MHSLPTYAVETYAAEGFMAYFRRFVSLCDSQCFNGYFFRPLASVFVSPCCCFSGQCCIKISLYSHEISLLSVIVPML